MAVHSVCDSPLLALFYLGMAGLDSGPVTARCGSIQPRLSQPIADSGLASFTLEWETRGHPSKPRADLGARMSSFRPGFVRANSVTKRLHRYSQICQRMEPRGHYVSHMCKIFPICLP